ncbi:MAG: type II secretion system F family protein [Bryobacterales bacterium]|nr:type II secretion system F family protein [Bryobacterales bacterium]
MTLMLAAFFAFVLLAATGGAVLWQNWQGDTGAGGGELGTGEAAAAHDDHSGLWVSLLSTLGGLLHPMSAGAEADKLRSQLFRAGHRSPSAVAQFRGLQLLASVLLALTLVWLALWWRGLEASLFVPAFAGLGFGFLAPKRLLEWQVQSRARRLRSALPPALDLIVLAIEAGQSVDQGINEASRSLARVYPDLASELTFCSLEMRAGTPRAEALRRMGSRCGEEEIKKLVAVLVDGERFGTSLGPALRSHAHYLRTRMRQRAQEQARKLSVKLVIPVFFLIFPSVMLVTLGPAYIQLKQYLGNMLK